MDEVIMISKDTAYVDEDGRIINQTVTRPLSSLYDFQNSYIINIYPDTTCWVNDFQNAYNEPYMKLYFSHPSYNGYPVVGVNWEQMLFVHGARTIYWQAYVVRQDLSNVIVYLLKWSGSLRQEVLTVIFIRGKKKRQSLIRDVFMGISNQTKVIIPRTVI